MKRVFTLLLLFTAALQMLNAQTNGMTPAQQNDVQRLVEAAKSGDKQRVASLVAYPLKRTYPLSDIKSKAGMLRYFDMIFDSGLLRQIARSKAGDWTAMGWRGLMLDRGVLWMDDTGKITAINYESGKEKILLAKAIQKDKQELPHSLQQFEKPLYKIITGRFRIRIDELAEGQLRYASWSLKSGKSVPALVLYNGVFEAQGTGGNHTIMFKNEAYRYEIAINRLGTDETPGALLTVFKGEKVLLKEPGKIIRK
ncbi:hypothetical protein GGU45_002765 [Niabella hirudinis]